MASTTADLIRDERAAQYEAVPNGHDWVLDYYGTVDTWRFRGRTNCNGPECSRCEATFCHHCDPARIKEVCPLAASNKHMSKEIDDA